MATASKRSGMLTGMFHDRASAEQAWHGLSERGYTQDDVSLMMSDETRRRHFGDRNVTTELGNKAAEGAGIGGGVGGVIGAALAAIAATGTSIALPGLGLVVAGPVAAALAGAGAGAATGGLLGGLIGAGIPEERVKRYEEGLKQGGILMGVQPRSDEDAAHLAQHWRRSNGRDVWGADDDAAAQGARGADVGDTVVGVYDTHDAAMAARAELLREGYSEHEVMLAHGNEGPAVQFVNGDQMSYRGVAEMFSPDTHREHFDIYSEAVRRGSHVLSVNVDGQRQLEQAMAIMNRHGAADIEERVTHWKNEGWTGYDANAPRYDSDQAAQERARHAQSRPTGDAGRIPVVEEQLAVGKREVERGGVRIVKRMRETPVQESVDLRTEHVHVERRPVDQAAGSDAFREQTIELRETAEEPVVEKTARVVEEVVVGKDVRERTEQIRDTVRRTEVEVERLDAGDDADYRRHWQNAYGGRGGRYEDYDAAYRYGSTMAGSGRLRNYQEGDWNSVEPDLRSDWEKSHPGSTWDQVKDAVRYGAERVSGRRH